MPTAYLSVSDVLLKFSRQHLAERAARDDRDVTGDGLARFAAGEVAEGDDGHAVLQLAHQRLAERVGDANATVDGYVLGRYAGQLDPVPEALATAAAVIFAYEFFGADPDDTDGRKAAWKRVVDWLKALAAGDIDLAVTDGGDTGTGSQIRIKSSPEVFGTDGALKDWLPGV